MPRSARLFLSPSFFAAMSACLRLLLFVLLLSGVVQAAPLQPRGSHPRLFFTAERLAALQARLAQEPTSAAAWTALRASADAAVAKPDTATRFLEPLAFAYRMTGDTRYAEAVRLALRRELSRPHWGEPDLLRREPVWHAGLGLARTLRSTAIGFDAIHDFLAPVERREFAAGIVRLGILPTLDDWVLGERRIHALDTMGHNWWSACVFTAGLGALAVLDEEPRARGWLERISAGSIEWFGYAGSVLENKPANFDRGGAFYESVNYASFALAEYLAFRLAWTNALTTPPAEIPALARVGDFFLDVAYPNAGPVMTLNFGDGSLHADGSRPLALLWANGYRTPASAWYLQRARTMSYREGLDRSTPLGLLYFPTDAELGAAPALPDRPTMAVYPDIGWAMLRSSWAPDATLLGLRCGYTWNHAHADAGSFILFHRGRNLLIDSGNCGYSRPEYDAYYRQSPAHNVVLWNGGAENPENTYVGSKFSGALLYPVASGDLRYLLADATGPTSRLFNRNYRHFLWIGDVILVLDDVEAFAPGQFEWLLHVGGKAERRGLDLKVADGDASVLVRPLFPTPFPDAGLPTDYPENMRLVEKAGFKDHDPDTKVTYYALAPSEQTRRTKFLTAITLVTPVNQDHLPTFERLSDAAMIGVRVRQGGTTTEVYVNLLADGRIRHRNANATLGGWETDAYLLAVTRPDAAEATDADGATRIFVADGSYLRRDGRVVLDSLSKVFLAARQEGGALEVQLQGQSAREVRWRVPHARVQVRLNGATVSPAFDPGSQTVLLTSRP